MLRQISPQEGELLRVTKDLVAAPSIHGGVPETDEPGNVPVEKGQHISPIHKGVILKAAVIIRTGLRIEKQLQDLLIPV